MCFGTCPHEKWSGECGKRKNDLCPAAFESDEDYWKALEEASRECDDPSDYDVCHS